MIDWQSHLPLFDYTPGLTPQEKLSNLQSKIVSATAQNDWQAIFDLGQDFDLESVSQKNCENVVGSVKLPLGLAGPVTVESPVFAPNTSLMIPLATTEGALVASVNRGCKVLRETGSTKLSVKKIGMTRAPVFKCNSGVEALKFLDWVSSHWTVWQSYTEATSRHLKLIDHQAWVRGRYAFVRFVFDTDQAMGMNMVTIALQAAWERLQASHAHELPVGVEMITLSSNVCNDKKDSSINRIMGRGYWVQAESIIPDQLLERLLKIAPEVLIETAFIKNHVGSAVAGSLSQNMHVGNMVAALYAATGQDLAHVTEGSQATTLVEQHPQGVYVSVTLPSVVVGVIGGGTGLPSQRQARQLILGDQDVTAEQLAGVVGIAALAGELSGLAALASHTLASAHARLGRGETTSTHQSSYHLNQHPENTL